MTCTRPDATTHTSEGHKDTQHSDSEQIVHALGEQIIALKRECAGAQDELGRLCRDVGEKKEQLHEIQSELERLCHQVNQARADETHIRTQVQILSLEASEIRADLEAVSTQEAQTSAYISALMQEAAVRCSQIEILQEEQCDLGAEIQELMEESTQRHADIETLSDRRTELDRHLREMVEEATQMRAEIDMLRSQRSEFSTQIQELMQQEVQMRAEIDALRAQRSELRTQTGALMQESAHMREELERLNQQECAPSSDVHIDTKEGMFAHDHDDDHGMFLAQYGGYVHIDSNARALSHHDGAPPHPHQRGSAGTEEIGAIHNMMNALDDPRDELKAGVTESESHQASNSSANAHMCTENSLSDESVEKVADLESRDANNSMTSMRVHACTEDAATKSPQPRSQSDPDRSSKQETVHIPDLERVQKDVDSACLELKQAKTDLETLKCEESEFKLKLAIAQRELDAANLALDSQKSDTERAHSETTACRRESDHVRRHLDAVNLALDIAKSDLERTRSEVAAYKRELQRVCTDTETANLALECSMCDIDRIIRERDVLVGDVQQVQKDKDDAKHALEQVYNELRSARAELDATMADLQQAHKSIVGKDEHVLIQGHQGSLMAWHVQRDQCDAGHKFAGAAAQNASHSGSDSVAGEAGHAPARVQTTPKYESVSVNSHHIPGLYETHTSHIVSRHAHTHTPETEEAQSARGELDSLIRERDACIQEVEGAREDAETAYLVLQSIRAEGERLREGIRVRRGALEALVSESEALQCEFKSWCESECLMGVNMRSDVETQTDAAMHGICAKCRQLSRSDDGIHTNDEEASNMRVEKSISKVLNSKEYCSGTHVKGERVRDTGAEEKSMPTSVLDDSHEHSSSSSSDGVSVDQGASNMGERSMLSALNSDDMSMESGKMADSMLTVRDKKDFAEHIARYVLVSGAVFFRVCVCV